MARKVSCDFAEREFQTGELAINYGEGPASGPTLVLLHGLTGNWEGYQDLMVRLSPWWHVLACDLRGHGSSGRDKDRYHLVDYVRDIVAFVRSQREPSVVLGHSLGALTALGVAAQAPGSVRALILLDPPVFLRNADVNNLPEITEWFAWVYEMMKHGPTLREIIEASRKQVPTASEDELVELAERVAQVAPESVGVVLRGQLLEGVDLGETVRKVRQPTLLVRGDWASGGVMREEDVEWFIGLIPHARVVRIPGGSHLFLWEQAEATSDAIEAFLDSLR